MLITAMRVLVKAVKMIMIVQTKPSKMHVDAVGDLRGLASTFRGPESAYGVREIVWIGGHDSVWPGLWRTHACLQTL